MISSLGLSNYKNINALLRKDNLDREIFIFDDMRDLSLPDEPVKLEMIIFAVCISGKGHVQINLKEYDVTPNSLVALLPNHIIQGYSISKDFKAIFLGITSEYAHEIIPDIHTLTPVVVSFKESPITLLAPGEVERLHEFHKFLWGKISSANDENTKKSVNCLLEALFFETLSIYGNHRNVAEGKRTRNEQIFFDFFTLVERNFKVNRSIAYYAKLLCISPKHLSATIKIMSGQTASEWIDNYVIIAAKAMLRSSSKTIQQISNDLNFSNQSFFGKFFKKYVGVSPTEYRTLRAK